MVAYGPYTPVRQAGNLLFISGQVGIDPKTKTAPKDVEGQTKQALLNLESVLHDMNASLRDIVKTTVFLVTMDDFTAMNVAYERGLPAPRPARSTVGIRELPRVAGTIPLLIEIEAIAYKETTL
jgi:2-iminobutanoate/2-iminopropanoate deaminase